MKTILTILLAITILIPTQTTAVPKKPKWEKVKVDRVTSSQHIKLFDGRTVQILGIKPLDIFSKKAEIQCPARAMLRTLKTLLEGQTIKIKQDEIKRDKNFQSPRHIKLASKQLLAELLLEEGLAKLDTSNINKTYQKKYKKAEKKGKAKNEKHYQSCSSRKYDFIRNRTGQVAQDFKKKYSSFLASISTGRIKKVFSGNLVELENGLKIKLLGIEMPVSETKKSKQKCFQKAAKQHLESIILGKKVFLQKDITKANEAWELPRYIFLPKTKYNNKETFINQKMVKDGFAKSSWKTPNTRFKKQIEKSQKEIYKNPKGAWVRCLAEKLDAGAGLHPAPHISAKNS